MNNNRVARLDLATGQVAASRFLVGRSSRSGLSLSADSGVAPSASLRVGALAVDADGQVYVGGRARVAFEGLNTYSLNGKPMRSLAGAAAGEPLLVVLDARLETARLTAAPREPTLERAGDLGSGTVTSIATSAARGGEVLATVTSEAGGRLFTGATTASSVVEAAAPSNSNDWAGGSAAGNVYSATSYTDAHFFLLRKPPRVSSTALGTCDPLAERPQPPPAIDSARWDEAQARIIVKFDVATDALATHFRAQAERGGGGGGGGRFKCLELFSAATSRALGLDATCSWLGADTVQVSPQEAAGGSGGGGGGGATLRTGDEMSIRPGRLFALFYSSGASAASAVLQAGSAALLPLARLGVPSQLDPCGSDFSFHAQGSTGGTKTNPLRFRWAFTLHDARPAGGGGGGGGGGGFATRQAGAAVPPEAQGAAALAVAEQLRALERRLNAGADGYGDRAGAGEAAGAAFWPRGLHLRVLLTVTNRPGYVHDGPASQNQWAHTAEAWTTHPPAPTAADSGNGPPKMAAAMPALAEPPISGDAFRAMVLVVAPTPICGAAPPAAIAPGDCVACDGNEGLAVEWTVTVTDLGVGAHAEHKLLRDARAQIAAIAASTTGPAIFFPGNTLFAGLRYDLRACLTWGADARTRTCGDQRVEPAWRELRPRLLGAPAITVAAEGGADAVALDASASTDPDWRTDGRPLLHAWSCADVLQDRQVR